MDHFLSISTKYRRRFSLFVAILFTVLGSQPGQAQQSERPLVRPQRILLLGQKPDGHPASTHEYMAGIQLLARQLERIPELQTVVVQADSPWPAGPELLDGADAAIVFLSEGAKWISESPERLAAFQRLAKRGGGLTCLHWGMGTREAGPIDHFTALFGACHGGPDRKYKVTTLTAKPADHDHPILHGLAPFSVRDEFYYALKQPAPETNVRVVPLLLVPLDGQDEMVAWAAERDAGRGFGFSGLHFHENWKLPEYRRLVLHGVLWTLHRRIPPEGLPVEVTPSDLALPAPQKP